MDASRETKPPDSARKDGVSGSDRAFSVPFWRMVHTLGIYVSTGIAACGWGFSKMLGFDASPYLPLWFAGAMLAYNIDRLKPDPADFTNVPKRHASAARLRRASRVVIPCALALLALVPLSQRNWLLLALVLAAAAACACYSLAPLGFRLKDVPILKSFFAPTVALAAFMLPPLMNGGPSVRSPFGAVAALWLWSYLCFNMFLCDLRDLEGDRAAGTRSLPVQFGTQKTNLLLVGCIGFTVLLGVAGSAFVPEIRSAAWLSLVLFGPLYQWSLLAVPASLRTEAFYEWRVEGMLFLPALVALALLD